jgi:tyrosyl-tRNA synthetase
VSRAFLADLEARGLLNQLSTPKLADALDGGRLTGYIGFDPTASSLHVGHLLQVLLLMRFQRAGHRPIALVGGGTGLIGDPSFKAAERDLIERDAIAANVAGIRAQLERFLDFDGDGSDDSGALLVDNHEWLGELRLVPFLRDVGKHFSVNQMVARDSVRTRLETREQGLSYTEFSYMLLQSYDFLELHDRHGCTVQMGGSDQWGNMVSGADLIRRMRDGEAYVLTQPLITKADGTKFGKTETGTVWLDPERTSPYELYQFWMNQADEDATRYLAFYTFMSMDEIRELVAAHAENPRERLAQRRLAAEITRLVHGDGALARAEHATAVLFGGDWHELTAQQLAEAFRGCAVSDVARSKLGTPDGSLVNLLAEVGVSPSRRRAREDVAAGAVRVNGERESDVERVVGDGDLLDGGHVVLRRGKKTYHVLRFSD